MAETVSPDGASVPLRARVPSSLRDALDVIAARESREGFRVTRSEVLRTVILAGLAARGEAVPA